MSVTTHSCQDGCHSAAPQASLASIPDLFGEAPEPSPSPSPGASVPPVLISHTSLSEDGMEDEPEQEPTLLDVLKIIKVNHSDLMGQDMHKI